MPKVSGSAPRALRSATTRASARAETLGSARSPSANSVSAAYRRGDTVMALPLSAEIERRDDRHAHMADAKAGGDRHRREQMRGVEQADIELVAHIRPRHFAHQLDIETFGRGKAVVDGDDQRRQRRPAGCSQCEVLSDSFEQLRRGEHRLCDLDDLLVFVHGGLAQQRVGLVPPSSSSPSSARPWRGR